MKLYPFFLYLCLIVSCTTTKSIQNLHPINQIKQATVYFSDGTKANLPGKKAKVATTIYLVRHAEKAKAGGKDPILTAEGNQRANRLKELLANAAITSIYSTEYQRTQLTAKPTAEAYGQAIKPYDPRDLKGFAELLKNREKGENILVVGHSNTTPDLVNALIGEEQYPWIEESAYGHFFVVTLLERGKVSALDLRY